MKKIYRFTLVLALPITFLFLTSEIMYPTGSPGGKTGSPGDNGNNCTQCHTGTPENKEGWIISPVLQVMGYSPNQSYSIIVAGYDESAQIYGFEVTAEDDLGNKVGTFEDDLLGYTQAILSNTAATHTILGTTPLTDSAIWLINWTAPPATFGDITFYAAVNAANGNGSSSGDQIYLTSMTVSPSTGIANRQEQQSLGIYPNPSDGIVSFEIPEEASGQKLEVMNLSGQVVYTAPTAKGKNSVDLYQLDSGIYIARVGSRSQRIIIR